ncbi:MAG: tRNA (adenosine(37)-N6)-threonylcarbamoyltransferase complex dimerization subunit type 1 TsaB [Ruminococcaceae bacterium]|nr:tRNA (adenosine(37)-N6)-threonylcarbamoyltransferase complex dimerization subunit type 1 TsaB [Oscillospiraceae bacterium]
MKILALDSTALVASVALCEDETLLGEITLNNGNTHSETLLPTVEFLLARFSLTADDIDLFAVSSGPGSFTGVRIGAATVKGLAFGVNKPCIGVSTLEALAYNLLSHDGLVCPVMNARRKQVYTALFRTENGTFTRLMPDSAIAIAELDAKLSEYDAPIRLVGDGYDITRELLTKETVPVPHRLRNQSAYSVAQVAKSIYTKSPDTLFTDVSLAPTYLRLSQAERERAERMQKDTGI